ncbi:RFX DNA-binding domain-containing protein [Radiomyces spectabilis]|uniref:RFX DNA-binding domain-containing protein n=1 Tax=Radiomyces spectabilis TaxID=64574 RepID=UPI002220841D|nr:RFX DNA-binding domain-containing protein [Radiomyces spectabilis]KAI8372832.1 RFX DNA-binding domain-containing protein [Radiomyces spectabilis]
MVHTRGRMRISTRLQTRSQEAELTARSSNSSSSRDHETLPQPANDDYHYSPHPATRRSQRSIKPMSDSSELMDSSGEEFSASALTPSDTSISDHRRRSTEGERAVLTDKATSQLVTNWVKQNYQLEHDHNVPRRGMYEHYKSYCASCNVQPVNSATFGKLIRTVFPEIKTRRLGTRGQSKYHYCGIRMQPSVQSCRHPGNLSGIASAASTVTRPQDDQQALFDPMSYYPYSDDLTPSTIPPATPASSTLASPPDYHSLPSPYIKSSLAHRTLPPPPSSDAPLPSTPSSQQPTHPFLPQGFQRTFSQGSISRGTDIHPHPPVEMPPFTPPILRYRVTFDYPKVASQLTEEYERHCRDLLMLVISGKFDRIEPCLADFYNNMPEELRNLIHAIPEITEAIWRWDSTLYDTIIDTLLPTVYTPMNLEMVKGLRQYTRELENYLSSNLKGYPSTLYQKKSDVARIFVAKFRRHLSLNHMAQAAAAILHRPAEITLMAEDWEKIDFGGVVDQALWICDCKNAEIEQILQRDVLHLLRSKANLDRWMVWTENLVDRYMSRYQSRQVTDCNQVLFQAKQLVLKWTLYSSLIMRDLTMRSAASFGSFHILRLFLDDHVLYVVEDCIAKMNAALVQSTSQVPNLSSSVDLDFLAHDRQLTTPPPSSSSRYEMTGDRSQINQS